MASANQTASSSFPCSQSEMCNVNVNLSKEQIIIYNTPAYLFISLTVGGFVKCVICLLGILGNVINCLVFYRQGLRDRMNLCLFSLAMSDFNYLVCNVVFSFVTLSRDLHLFGIGEEHYLVVVTYYVGTMYAFRTTSGLYIMVIAVERCVCVALPLRSQSLIRTRTIAIILATFAIISQLGYICQPLKYHVVQTITRGTPEWQLVPSEFWLSNKDLVDTIVYTVFSIVVPILTFLVVSVATFVTVIQLTAAIAWRRKTSFVKTDQNDQQVALTKTLMLASCVYIASMIPIVSIKAVRLFIEEFAAYGPYADLYLVCNTTANVASVTNGSVNFLIYYSRSSRYRSVLSHFRFCKIKNMEYLESIHSQMTKS